MNHIPELAGRAEKARFCLKRLVHPQGPPAHLLWDELMTSASLSLSNAMFSYVVPSEASTGLYQCQKLPLLGENSLRCPYISCYFPGALESPTHHCQPWYTSVGLFAMGKNTWGVAKQAQNVPYSMIPFV